VNSFKIKNPLLDTAFWAAMIPALLLFAPEQLYERASQSPELLSPIIIWIGGNTFLRKKAIEAEAERGGDYG